MTGEVNNNRKLVYCADHSQPVLRLYNQLSLFSIFHFFPFLGRFPLTTFPMSQSQTFAGMFDTFNQDNILGTNQKR